jgi:hypothetical protein
MSEHKVYHKVYVDADPLAFLLGVYAGLALVCILIMLKDKKNPAKISPIRKSHAEKEETSE